MFLKNLIFPYLLLFLSFSISLALGNNSKRSIIHLRITPPAIPLPLAGGEPFVTLFADDYYRGGYYHHFLKNECTNLPSQYNDWASSIDTYDRCVYLCEDKDCSGPCKRVHNTKLDRLYPLGLNDNISSLKFCYTFAQRGKK